MIAHALFILQKELNAHLTAYYAAGADKVLLENMAEGLGGNSGGSVPRENIVLMVVNTKEEKTLKNLPNYVRNDVTLPASLIDGTITEIDQLETFKLILDFYSPTLEEVNHLWGTLGGKQYPFVLYMMRMLDLKFKAVQSESGLITEVVSDFYHQKTANN